MADNGILQAADLYPGVKAAGSFVLVDLVEEEIPGVVLRVIPAAVASLLDPVGAVIGIAIDGLVSLILALVEGVNLGHVKNP